MSQVPPPYDRQANFVSEAINNPTASASPTKLDAEFDSIERALDATQARLLEIQRDDGKLKNGIVTNDSIDPAVVFPGDRISQNSITAYHLTEGCIGTPEIVDGAVTTDKIADNSITAAKIVDGSIAIGDIAGLQSALNTKQPAGSYVSTSDARLTDSRNPTQHKSTHATGGADALSPGDIGAAPATHSHGIAEVTGLSSQLSSLSSQIAGKQDVGNYVVDAPSDGTFYSRHMGAWAPVTESGQPLDWSEIVNKPASFPPTSHTHTVSQVTGLQTALNSKLEDAPSDGGQYARKDGAWESIQTGNPFNQTLNTTDDVTFNSASLGGATVGTLYVNGGIATGGTYINTEGGEIYSGPITANSVSTYYLSIVDEFGSTTIDNAGNITASGSITAPNIPTTFFSGDYADLTGKPSIPTTSDQLTEGTTNLFFTSARAISAVTWSTLTGKPTFAAVATSGSAADLTGTLADARLSTNVSLDNQDNAFSVGQTINQGTLTAQKAALAANATWNNSGVTFTGIRLNVTNTASASSSLLMDLQVGGTSVFQIDRGGSTTISGSANYRTSNAFINNRFMANNTAVYVGSTAFIGFTANAAAEVADADTRLYRDAANTLAQRNGTTAQAFRVYNTFTDASNFERGVFDWTTTANTLTIGNARGGTGASRDVRIRSTNNVDIFALDTTQAASFRSGATIIYTPLQFVASTLSANPTTSDLSAGRSGLYKNSTSGDVRLWYNDAGTMKSATVSTSGGGGGGATGGGTDTVFYNNGQTVTTNYTIPTGQNSGSFGPITIANSVTVTVPDGSTYTVV